MLSLRVFIKPKATSQTDPLPVPTLEHPQFKLIVATGGKYAIFHGLSGQRPPAGPHGMAFAEALN
jgi:hypothetical protein